jgi:hypothetical protein
MAMAAVLTQFNVSITLNKKQVNGQFWPIISRPVSKSGNGKRKIYTNECDFNFVFN